MFLGPNDHRPVTSIAGGIDSRSSSTDNSSGSSSGSGSGSGSCQGDIGADDVGVRGLGEKCCDGPKSRTERHDFCRTASAPSYKLPTKTETDGGAIVAGEEQAGLVLDLTDLHLRPSRCGPSHQQHQYFSYSGATAAARRQRPLIMHHSAPIYEEEGEFAVLSEYSSSTSSAAGTPNSDDFFFGDDDFEEKEDSCLGHIPRLREWRAVRDATTPRQQEAGADDGEWYSGGGSPRQWRVTSRGLTSVHEEDETESVNIARHAAIGTLGREDQQAAQNGVPTGGTLRGENRRANARASACACARARANARGHARIQVSPPGPVDISSSDADAPPVRLKSSSDFVYLTPRDQQQLRRSQQRQQLGEGEDLEEIKKPRCLDFKAAGAFEDKDSDDGLHNTKNDILDARVVDVRVTAEGGGRDRGGVGGPGEFELDLASGRQVGSRSLTPDTGATSISSRSSSSEKSSTAGGNGVGGGGVEQHSLFHRRPRSGKFRRSSSNVLQGSRTSVIGFTAEDRSFERSDSFSLFARNTGPSTASKGRSQSLRDDSADGKRRRNHRQSNGGRAGVLRLVSRGINKVWGKVTSDHPEPLPVNEIMTKKERKALRRRRELELLEDWQTNSTAELHQVRVVCKEEETVWR